MADRRIRMAKDKVDLVRHLTASENENGPFRHLVDVLSFAAALGYAREIRIPLTEPAKSPDPIRQSVFQSHGYDTVLNLLAAAHTSDPAVLANNDEMEDVRATVFEEYANGGLELLQTELKGSTDVLQSVLLIIAKERMDTHEGGGEGFDISQLMD